MSNVNFDMCNTTVFDPAGVNEYFLKAVESGTSKKGNQMWVCHFVPVVKKDEAPRESKSDYTFYPSELTEWVVFDDKNNITNPIGISKWCKALSRDGETNIGKVLKNAVNNPNVSVFVLCDIEESEYNGKPVTNFVPSSIWKKQPTAEQIKEAKDYIANRNAMSSGIKDALNKSQDDDDDMDFI